jgi:hypothetical protein
MALRILFTSGLKLLPSSEHFCNQKSEKEEKRSEGCGGEIIISFPSRKPSPRKALSQLNKAI